MKRINKKLLEEAVRQSNQRNPELEAFCDAIKEEIGIELNTTEQIKMSIYWNSMKKAWDEGLFSGREMLQQETMARFLVDCLGIDYQGMLGVHFWKYSFETKFIGEKEFKQYCRDNIDRWRDERGML